MPGTYYREPNGDYLFRPADQPWLAVMPIVIASAVAGDPASLVRTEVSPAYLSGCCAEAVTGIVPPAWRLAVAEYLAAENHAHAS